jgi:hypothetical protein
MRRSALPAPHPHAGGLRFKLDLIIVPARQGHFFQPGKNPLSLKQLAGLTKTLLPGLHFIRGWPKR